MRWILTWARRLAGRGRDLMVHENNVLLALSFVVGLLAGAGAIILQELLRAVGTMFLGSSEPSTDDLLRVGAAPVIGGLIVGPLVSRFAREAKGHGVPEVMEAVALRGGRIRGRVALVKTVASAISIGSGGSAGREGPIVQIGATLGSRVGIATRMSDERIRVLVAAGAAGGISAAFNAPLAGVFFALEVILQRFTTRGFATVVVSAVTANVVWRARYGNDPVLDVPQFGLRSPAELLFYVLLGLVAALAAIVFVRLLYAVEDGFGRLKLIDDLKPAIGGALLAGVGVLTVVVVGAPIIYGSGLLGIDQALNAALSWRMMLFLGSAKIIATSFTLGSGGSGGVFAPSLFIGAMFGGALGSALASVVPDSVAAPGAYAMVGMAAVFAAAGQAPISAILILFEMTNDYRIILPLMLACIIASSVYSILQHDSIYAMKIRRKGIELSDGRERHLLEVTPLGKAILPEVNRVPVPPDAESALDRMRRWEVDWLVCVDSSNRFIGMLLREDVERLVEAEVESERVGDVLDADSLPVLPTESLDDAIGKMAARGLRVLPAIDNLVSRRVVGVVTRESVSASYWAAAAEAERSRPRGSGSAR